MRKGSTVPQDVREKIRSTLLLKGLLPPNNKGKKYRPRSLEHRTKIGENKKGAKCNFWKGGTTGLVRAIKNTLKYKEWRRGVFERDDYTCVFCLTRGSTELAPDHIKPFSEILKERGVKTVEQALACNELWNLDNGRTLCHPCHKTTDTYGWKIYNRKK